MISGYYVFLVHFGVVIVDVITLSICFVLELLKSVISVYFAFIVRNNNFGYIVYASFSMFVCLFVCSIAVVCYSIVDILNWRCS